MTSWVCAECEAKNTVTGKFCAACGSPRRDANTPAQPEFVPPWKRPDFKPSKPDDACPGGPDCTLEGAHTIRDHIAAFKAYGERILARAVKL